MLQASIRAELLPDCAAADMPEPLLLPAVSGGHGHAALGGAGGIREAGRDGGIV